MFHEQAGGQQKKWKRALQYDGIAGVGRTHKQKEKEKDKHLDQESSCF